MRFRKAFSLLKAAAAGSVRDGTAGMGAALAFYTVFSLGPLLVIATTVAAHVLGGDEARAHFTKWAERYFSVEGAKAVQNMVSAARSLRSGLLATLIGVLALFFGATGVFGQFKRSLNAIWSAAPRPRPAVHVFLLNRLAAFAVACGLGFIIFLGLLLSAGITALGGLLGGWLPLAPHLLLVVNLLLSLVIVTPLAALVFKYLPDAEVPWRSVWIGAAATAVLFQAGALAVGMFLGARPFSSVYGASGSVLAVLLWAYYTALAVLFGAELAKAHATADQ